MLKPVAVLAALVLPSAIALADTGTEAAQPAAASVPFPGYPQFNPQQVFVVSNDDVGNVGLFAATSSNGGVSFTSKHVATGTDGLPSACCDPSASWDQFLKDVNNVAT